MDVIQYNWTLRDKLEEYNNLSENVSTDSKLFLAEEVIKELNNRVNAKQTEEKFIYNHLIGETKPFVTLVSNGKIERVPDHLEVYANIDLGQLMEDIEFYSACKKVCEVLKKKIEKEESKE